MSPSSSAKAARPSAAALRAVIRKRAAVLRSLDPMVKRVLRRRVAHQVPAAPVLTVYDAVYPAAPQEGGHWTAAGLRLGWFSHTVRSYAVAVIFDRANRPRRFRISGAHELVTQDTSEAALAAGLAEAMESGPQETAAPSFPGGAL